MKLSIYDPNPLNELATIYLNGIEQKHVVEASVEDGYVKRYKLGSKFAEIETLTGSVEIDFEQPKTDPVVEAVRADLLERSKVGIAKYGFTLAGNQGDLRYWLQHAYEETLDHANYLKRAIMELDKQNGNK